MFRIQQIAMAAIVSAAPSARAKRQPRAPILAADGYLRIVFLASPAELNEIYALVSAFTRSCSPVPPAARARPMLARSVARRLISARCAALAPEFDAFGRAARRSLEGRRRRLARRGAEADGLGGRQGDGGRRRGGGPLLSCRRPA